MQTENSDCIKISVIFFGIIFLDIIINKLAYQSCQTDSTVIFRMTAVLFFQSQRQSKSKFVTVVFKIFHSCFFLFFALFSSCTFWFHIVHLKNNYSISSIYTAICTINKSEACFLSYYTNCLLQYWHIHGYMIQ